MCDSDDYDVCTVGCTDFLCEHNKSKQFDLTKLTYSNNQYLLIIFKDKEPIIWIKS